MMKILKCKRILAVILCLSAALSLFSFGIGAEDGTVTSLEKSGIAVYDLFGGDAAAIAEALSLDCASAILMEAIDSGAVKMTDMVTVSANAASMGGSQVYLEEGEEMVLEDLLKSVVIASANDAAVALAEYVAGSETAFVARMNARAAELGATSAHFENTNGLDDTVSDHVLSARDIAILSRELIRHKEILKYSSIWMDTIRDGAFGLTNTNRLVRFYPGCTGLKTGSTSKAGFCVSVTAEREGLSLIAVIMGAETRDTRNASAVRLLDWGFASFALATVPAGSAGEIRVTGGVESSCKASYPEFFAVVPKGERNSVRYEVTVAETVAAEIGKGDKVGEIIYYCGDRELGRADVTADETVRKINYGEVFLRMLRAVLLARRSG